MKRKTITLVIYMLVCISLVSVGFAAWVITGGDNTEATGNVTASTVTDKSLTATVPDFETGYENINFGSPIDSSGNAINNDATKWFQFDTVDKENLVAKFSFTLSVGDTSAKLSETLKQVSLTYTVTYPDSTDSTKDNDVDVDSLITKGYVKAPMFSAWWGSKTESSPCVTPTEEDKFADALFNALTSGTNAVASSSVTINIKIEYDWGSVFNYDNPYYFFNGNITVENKETPITGSTVYSKTDEKTVTYKDLAIEALGDIEEAFKNQDTKYTMILNFESVSAQ